jgi:aryl-alcohol dehydrogenase-like predicted oxidoreductase
MISQIEETQMQTKQLGNSELYITPIGFGAWAIGGSGWAYGWGSQDDAESIEAIHRAIDSGMNWILRYVSVQTDSLIA